MADPPPAVRKFRFRSTAPRAFPRVPAATPSGSRCGPSRSACLGGPKRTQPPDHRIAAVSLPWMEATTIAQGGVGVTGDLHGDQPVLRGSPEGLGLCVAGADHQHRDRHAEDPGSSTSRWTGVARGAPDEPESEEPES